jgi:hypothetical protein
MIQYVNGDIYDPDAYVPTAVKNEQQLVNLTQFTPVDAVNDIFTFDLSRGLNFSIVVGDTNAKTIQFSNVPTNDNIILPITVLVTYTSAAPITHPIGIVWQNGITPVFTAGKKYVLMYSSWNNGTTWRGSISGAWSA